MNPRRGSQPSPFFGRTLTPVSLTFETRAKARTERGRTEQSFCVPKADIAGNGYDLSINRYREVVHGAVEHLPPKEILAKLARLEEEIQAGMRELEGMLR